MAMLCRNCNSTNTRVVVTERKGYETWRYNRCLDCDSAYKTIERFEKPKRGAAPGVKSHPNHIKRGEENPWSVLTEENVKEIRLLAKNGETYSSISQRYGIHKHTVYKIVKRKLWAHV